MLKRRDERHPVIEPGLLRVEGSPPNGYVVMVLDVSKTGLRVSCSSALPTDTRVEVKARGAGIRGEVRYARNVGPAEYHLGIKVDDASNGARSEDGELDLTLLFQLKSQT